MNEENVRKLSNKEKLAAIDANIARCEAEIEAVYARMSSPGLASANSIWVDQIARERETIDALHRERGRVAKALISSGEVVEEPLRLISSPEELGGTRTEVELKAAQVTQDNADVRRVEATETIEAPAQIPCEEPPRPKTIPDLLADLSEYLLAAAKATSGADLDDIEVAVEDLWGLHADIIVVAKILEDDLQDRLDRLPRSSKADKAEKKRLQEEKKRYESLIGDLDALHRDRDRPSDEEEVAA